MGSTDKTTYKELSQFIDTDKPTWRGDYNSDMVIIDTELSTINDEITIIDGEIVELTSQIPYVVVKSPGNGENATAAFMAAFDIAKVHGRTVYFRAGTYLLDAVVLDTQITICGDRGQNGDKGTVITYTATAGPMITTNKTITIHDIDFLCSAPGTADFLYTSVVLPTILQLCEITNCLIANFDRGIVSENGVALTVTRNQFKGIKTHSIVTIYGEADAGDHLITDNLFTADGGTTPGLVGDHIYTESSSGLRIINNKFFGADRCVHVKASAAGKTLVVIVGNSMELTAVESIKIETFPGASFNNVIITGNEFGPGSAGGTALTGVNLGYAVYSVTITGNTFAGGAFANSAAIRIAGAFGISISGNHFYLWETAIDASAGPDSGSFNQSGNSYLGCAIFVKEFATFVGAPACPYVDNRYRVNMGSVAGLGVNDIFSITLPEAYSSVKMKVTFAGLVQGAYIGGIQYGGSVMWEEEFIVMADPSGVVTVTSTHQDKVGPGIPTMNLDISTTGLVSTLRVAATNEGSGISGYMTIDVKGFPCSIKQLIGQ